MKILEYYYKDVEEPGWEFEKVNFGSINLLVGDTATGKSRFLNTIFNLGRFVVFKEFKNGIWDLCFEHNGANYRWKLETEKEIDKNKLGVITKEALYKKKDGTEEIIVERNKETFTFSNNQLPKLSPRETSISLLQEEDKLRDPFDGFSVIQRRLFNKDALQVTTNLQAISVSVIETVKKKKDLRELFGAEYNLSINLFLLSNYFAETYEKIMAYYQKVFPFIQETKVIDFTELHPNIPIGGNIPVFVIREKGSKKWIPITEFSSGMQKVLLILTDIYIIPKGGVYIIEEYENSLGVTAIDFFPEFVLELEKDVQFFITSHHPYVINGIPPDRWYIFHRKGMNVSIRHGEEIKEKYSKSKQQAFIQLINDPFYSKGVE